MISPLRAVAVIFAAALAVFAGSNPSDSWLIFEKKVTSKTANVAINLENTEITKVRVISEKTGRSERRDVGESKILFLTVELEEGKNGFTVISYRKENDEDKYDASRSTSFMIERRTESVSTVQVSNDTCKNCTSSSGSSTSGGSDDEKRESTESNNFRAIIGLEQSGAASADGKQSPFIDLFVSQAISPIHRKTNDGKLVERTRVLSLWGNIRVGTSPIQSIASLSNFSSLAFANNFIAAQNSEVNDMVQAFDTTVGLEYRLFVPNYDRNERPKNSISFILGGGITSTLSSQKSAQFFNIPQVPKEKNKLEGGETVNDPDFIKLFPEAAGKDVIAFVSPERDRFFRQYFAGLRFKSYRGERFPAMLDLTFGQNEAITGIMRGVILKIDGSYPLKFKKAKYLYLFGGTQLRLGRAEEQGIPQFFLSPSTVRDLTAVNTVAVPIDRSPYVRSNRDTYRIGVGVDLFQLFKGDESENADAEEKKP